MKGTNMLTCTFRINLLIFMICAVSSQALAQDRSQKSKPPVIVIDICLPPAAPSPTPIPYPNISMRNTNKKNSGISRGQVLTFTMSGNRLENLGSVGVYSKGSKNNSFLAKLDQVPRGKKQVSQRKIIITAKDDLPASAIYRINFRRDLKSKAFYSTDFRVAN
ncbi:MAG: hypothetical protein IPL46_18665 [Saprospiraceae bacterium]|nr:hypothetical protein [Saprospiraceae bacterium]